MSISALASLCRQSSTAPDIFYDTSCFQTFVAGVEETLEERLTEISAIAISRADATVTNMLCDLALDALLHNPKPHISIASSIL
ncbi:hypothetical protein IFO70_18245 [Phormidium tenue FACHB-886]|nr:hypothetical protein [Phormidium tenue FACHB-886]